MEENKKLERISNFFRYDIKVKNILYDVAPREEYNYKDGIIEYVDKLYEALDDLYYYIMDMTLFANPSEVGHVEKLFPVYKNLLGECKEDFGKLTQFYETCFSNLRPEIVQLAGTECFGYGGFGVSLSKAITVNELLHILHILVPIIHQVFFQKH